MKRIILILSACFLIGLFGCDKKEQENEIIEKAIFDLSFFENSVNAADFNRVIRRQYENFLNHPRDKGFVYDHDYFKELLTQKTLQIENENDLMKIIAELGFSNLDELYEYDRVIKAICQELYENTDFFESESPNKSQYFQEYFKKFVNSYDKSCINAFSSCVNQAHASYTFDVLMCTAAAISVGSVTFGLGGVVVQLACCGAAYWKFSSNLDNCFNSYENCK